MKKILAYFIFLMKKQSKYKFFNKKKVIVASIIRQTYRVIIRLTDRNLKIISKSF